MNSLSKDIKLFQKQLKSGELQRAYKATLSYVEDLRNHIKNSHLEIAVSSLKQGNLDASYFSIITAQLKQYDLKIAIIFNYNSFSFEAWLVGRNKKATEAYYETFAKKRWPKYKISAKRKGFHSIMSYELSDEVDLENTKKQTSQIDKKLSKFIKDIESHLTKEQSN